MGPGGTTGGNAANSSCKKDGITAHNLWEKPISSDELTSTIIVQVEIFAYPIGTTPFT